MKDISHHRMGLLKKNIRAARRSAQVEENERFKGKQGPKGEFEEERVAGTSYRWYGRRRLPRRKGAPIYH